MKSLAARLAVWYAASAFLLVAAATALQYRTLSASLASEDDQLLQERLQVAQAAAADGAVPSSTRGDERPRMAPTLIASNRAGARPWELPVRFLDSECQPQTAARSREALPPPDCPPWGTALDSNPVVFRTTRGPDGDEWRSAVMRWSAAGGSNSGNAHGWVEVLLDRSRDQDVLKEFRTEAAVVLLGALGVSALLGYVLARRGLRPLATLRERVTRIDARSLDLRLAMPNAPREVTVLAESFDAMLERLQGAFDVLSVRSAELAHEVRTPLHVLRQQAEVALRRERTPDEYRDILGSSLEEFDRLRRLVDDTLFLARAADPRATVSREPLDAAAELGDIAAYLDALAEEADVGIKLVASAGVTVVADRALFRRAIVNLVTNALRHTPPGGRITLRASPAAEPGGTTISVEDTGEGLTRELLERAFEPYSRRAGAPADSPDAARLGVPSGAGLGLAIVRGIMELHGGTATLHSEPGRGTRATLVFPG